MTAENRFFKKINYSASNEDEQSEILALGQLTGRSVLCVTASGARPLSLLISDPERVVAVDLNPTQNHLLELKIAAFRHLEYDELLEFLGVTGVATDSKARRWSVFVKMLAQDLSTPAREFWQAHRSFIETGVLYCGAWEGYQRMMATPLRWMGIPYEQILNADDISEQRRILRQSGRETWVNGLLWMTARRWIWRWVLREPGIEFVEADFDIYQYLRSRIEFALDHHHLRDSAFHWLLWTGRYQHALPVHLRREHFAAIRSRLDRVEIRTASLVEILEEDTCPSWDGFSLSDFSSYCRREDWDHVWAAIARRARPQAKVVARQFLVRHPLTTQGFERNEDLELRLRESDETALYTFICATRVMQCASPSLEKH